MTTKGKVLGRRAVAAGILVLGALAASPHAAADGTAGVTVSVTAVPTAVTLSRPGAQSFASYQITIRNTTGSSLGHVRFLGSTDVDGDVALFINPNVSEAGVVLDPNPVAVSSGTVQCTIEDRSIDCHIDLAGHQLPQGGVASFYAVVRAPAAGSGIDLRWSAQYGAGTASGSIAGSTVTALQAGGGNSASAYVPRAGATLFTGANAVPDTVDRATTLVTVAPQDATAITASIVEDDNGGNSCSPHVHCFGATITVLKDLTHTKAAVGDGLRSVLLIVLRRDASTLRQGSSIKDSVILYQVIPAIGGGGAPVRLCYVNGIYTPPGPDDPCIRERKEHPRTRSNAAGSSLSGDWEYQIEAFDNGRFIM